MLLYHYTDYEYSWLRIQESGHLKTTDAVINLRDHRKQPVRVVWLTSGEPEHQHWHQMDESTLEELARARGLARGTLQVANKLEVRITVDVPVGPGGAEHYPAFAKRYGVSRKDYRRLADTGGDPETWYVVPRRIYQKEWIKAELTENGTILWQRDGEDGQRI